MPNVIRKVTFAKKQGETWGAEMTLSTARIRDISIGWGSQKDAASIKLSKGKLFFDDYSEYTPVIEPQDLLRFYVAKNKTIPYTFTTDDLLFEGTVDTVTQNVNSSANEITINTFNFYEVFFDVEVPYYNTNLTFIEHAEALLLILQKAGTVVSWDPSNPTVAQTGLAFDKQTISLDYTPAFVILEKLCGQDITGDGQYYWYLSKSSSGQRMLSIRPKSSSTESLVIDETLPIQTISLEKGKDVVVNYVIFNTGVDLYLDTVESLVFDASSIGKYGWKTHFLIEETGSIFSALHQEEVTRNSSRFTFDANGALTSPFPTSYSSAYTFYFDSTKTATSDTEFNETLREQALAIGERMANNFLEKQSKSQYICNINLPYRNDLVIGGLYEFNLSKLRTFSKPLRLKNITYQLSGITATFDQDEKDRT